MCRSAGWRAARKLLCRWAHASLFRFRWLPPPFEARGEVVWCRRVDACYELGIQFSSEADAFAARMVEQLCYIERYRNEVLAREGRVIDSQTAASEWISKFAASFPHIS